MSDAHKWLLEYVSIHGPYDAVMTFSQGGSLVSSMLISHSINTPHLPLPFKFGVFICSGVPLGALDELGVPVSEKARKIDRESVTALFSQASSEAILAAGVERWRGVEVAGFVEGENMKENDFFGLDFSSFPKEWRIDMPTVHIYGRRDPRYPASKILAHFCIEGKRKEFDHGAGHEIPRKKEISAAIAKEIDLVINGVEWEAQYG